MVLLFSLEHDVLVGLGFCPLREGRVEDGLLDVGVDIEFNDGFVGVVLFGRGGPAAASNLSKSALTFS